MYKETLKKISKSKYAVVFAAGAVMAIITIVSIVLFKFSEIERQRDLANWEARLNVMADSRANAVNEWVERQFSELETLAHNQSLRLYSSQITESELNLKEDPFQVAYLRNLLISTAERTGFSEIASQKVNANVPVDATSGIAILDKNTKVLVTTNSMPPLAGRLAEIITNLPRQERYISNIYNGVDDRPTVVFSAPIRSLQEVGDSKNYVGNVIGIRTVDSSLFRLLKQPGETGKTAEVLLVRVDGGMINYLTPTKDGSQALSKNLTITPDLEANFAVVEPGKFAVKRDYAFNEVLVTGRKIPNTPWTLLYKIDRDEALAESDKHINNLLTIWIIAILFVVAAMIAAWHYINFLKESRVSARYHKMMLDLKAQKHILRLITDNKPEATFIVDSEERYHFANLKAAQQANMNANDIIGKTIIHVMGKEKATPYIRINNNVIADRKTIVNIRHVHEDGEDKVIQSSHIPLLHIPGINNDGKFIEGVLVIEHDITAHVRDKEKIARIRDALIDSLVSLIDRRDHYTANHSLLVSKLAVCIAREIGVGETIEETVGIAGKLMNLGRALIPLDLITKTTELTQQERSVFEDTNNITAELIQGIEFDGPVVDTILQTHEWVDGSGTLGLKDDEILLTAKIIAVANAFVAMCSPRAYRQARTADESLKEIVTHAGSRFDRKVVAALINHMENRGGREEFANIFININK